MNSIVLVEPAASVAPTRVNIAAEQATSWLALAIDALVIVVTSLFSGMAFHYATRGIYGDFSVFAATGSIAAAIFCSTLRIQGANKKHVDLSSAGRARNAVVVWSLTFLFLFVLAFGLKISSQFSRGTVFVFYLAGLVTVPISRWNTPQLLAQWSLTNAYRGLEPIIVAPTGEARASQMRDTLLAQGCEVVRLLEFHEHPQASQWISERTLLVNGIFEAAHSAAQGDIYLFPGCLSPQANQELLNKLRILPRAVYLIPDENTSAMLRYASKDVGSALAVELQKAPLSQTERGIKRATDIAAALSGIIFLAPLLFAIAISIKINSRGPVLFRQHRLGYRGKPFRIAKFRSMKVQENSSTVTQATRNDKRVTRLGRFLRKTSLDELPQLWNVLTGDMSIIGPRPHAAAHDTLYARLIENYEVRQHVRPGITGWAQVNGLRGETPQLDLMYRRIELDIWYATNCSLSLDAQILAKTFVEVLRQRNAY